MIGRRRKRLRLPRGIGHGPAMRIRALTVALAALLAGCASGVVPAGPVGAPAGPVRGARGAPAMSGDLTSVLLRAGTANAITTSQARQLLGPPDVERRDGAGALMVWTLPSCALTLGFANDRLRTVDPGPRRTGDPAPGLQTCVAEAHARTPVS